MKIKSYIVLVMGSILVFGCSSAKRTAVANAELDQMMNKKEFTIQIRTAEPLLTQAMSQVMNSGVMAPGNSLTRIDVTGAGFFITVKGDSVKANLPYYGERQMGGGYDRDQGIKFNGITKSITLTKDEDKLRYIVNFKINSSTENFVVSTSITNSALSTTTISSSQRNRIRYSGKIIALEEDEN